MAASLRTPTYMAGHPTLSRVQVWSMSIEVPPSWQRYNTANQVTITGPKGRLVLSRNRHVGFLPLVGNVPSGAFIPGCHAYLISWHQPSADTRTYVGEMLIPSGTLFRVNLQSPPMDVRLDCRIVASWRYPPVITSTQSVQQRLKMSVTKRAPQTNSSAMTSRSIQQLEAHEGLLVSGFPLATMSSWESWNLVETTLSDP